jgi:hypothetical protein
MGHLAHPLLVLAGLAVGVEAHNQVQELSVER